MNINQLKKLYSKDPEMLKALEAKEQTELLKEMLKSGVVTDAQLKKLQFEYLKGEQGVEGPVGPKPEKYVDYFTDGEIVELANYIKEDIKDEVTPIKGKDYFDGKDADESAMIKRLSQMIPTVEEIVSRVTVPQAPQIDTNALMSRLMNAIPKTLIPSVEDIVKEIKSKKLLELRDIKGARLDMNDQRWHGGGISNITGLITAGTNISITGLGTASGPYNISASGSGISPLTTKGDLYTFTTVDARLPVGTNGQILSADSTQATGLKWISASGTGTVTSVSVVTANGISGSVATATTTPAITLTLGAITPTSVNGVTFSGSGTLANTGTSALTNFTGSGTTSGTNTGDQTTSGTSNRITVSSGATNPVIDIAATYVGQTSITTLGTVTTGTWNGTTITIANGGTGQTTKAAAFDALSPMTTSGDIIYGGASGTGTRLAKGTDGFVLTLASGLPSWAAPTGGSGITIGTTTITSGTTTRILYDNAGVVGEYTITGTGTVVAMQTSPVFTTPTLGVATATRLGVGVAADASRLLLVQGDVSGGVATIERLNAATTGTLGTAIIKATSSGDMADGFGAGFQFAIQDNAAVENLIGFISATRFGGDTTSKMLFAVSNAGLPAANMQLTTTTLSPVTNDGVALGTSALSWSDLFLASGAVINIAASNWVATHTSGILTVGTGDLRVSTAGTNTASVVTVGGTQTLSNKRNTPRTGTTTSSGTPTINTDTTDFFDITAQAAAITSFTTNLTGTPVKGDTLWIAITDNGTARAITWGASFESSGTVTLPTTTVISTRLDVRFVWNNVTSKWRCVGTA